MKYPVILYPAGHFAEPVYAWWPNYKPLLAPEPTWLLNRRAAGKKGAEANRASTVTSYFIDRRGRT